MPFLDLAPILVATNKKVIKAVVVSTNDCTSETLKMETFDAVKVRRKEKEEDEGEEKIDENRKGCEERIISARATTVTVVKMKTEEDALRIDSLNEKREKTAVEEERDRRILVCRSLARKIIKR